MRTCIFLPPVPRYSGGVAVLLHMARHLHEAGFQVELVPREQDHANGPPGELQITPWTSLQLAPEDIWLVPEGWVNALTPGLQAGARCLVYCQNWAYLFSSLPENVHWGQLPVTFLAVSAPVAWYIAHGTAQRAAILRPGIDVQRFAPPAHRPDGPLRIAYMPRKNKAQVERVREMVTARQTLASSPLSRAGGLEWVSISGLSQAEVAECLASCHFFLASGFPEGCPLPPLEAMACGCFTVGFAGFGGWDYMRQTAPDLPYARPPWLPLDEADIQDYPDFSGNGIWLADADAPAAALALEQAVAWKLAQADIFSQTLENARKTAMYYSLERQKERSVALWSSLRTA